MPPPPIKKICFNQPKLGLSGSGSCAVTNTRGVTSVSQKTVTHQGVLCVAAVGSHRDTVLQQGQIRVSPRHEATMGKGVLRKQAWRMWLGENGM